jgi:hypothetical protein
LDLNGQRVEEMKGLKSCHEIVQWLYLGKPFFLIFYLKLYLGKLEGEVMWRALEAKKN